MTRSTEPIRFSPFYDPPDRGTCLTVGGKVLVSLSLGGLYILMQYLVMLDKATFYSQYCWILGIIISTCLMSLYVSTDIFRSNIETIDTMLGNDQLTRYVVEFWLTNNRFLLAGLFWGTCNTLVAHLLGIPGELYSSALSLLVMYLGYFFSGFAAGMGMLVIIAVIVLNLKLAPELIHSLDSNSSAAAKSLKKLSDALWVFAALISLIGVLVSMYMFAVDWQLMHLSSTRAIFLFWISQPYLVAISIVLIPGLAVRRQVSHYKSYRINQLKREKTELYMALKKFEASDDESIIQRQKDITERLNALNTKVDRLKKLRSYHIESRGDF
jgi:hypothetical protein